MSVLPTLMTLGNLTCGFAAIHYAAKPIEATGAFGWSALMLAGALVFCGMFFDAIDGSVARLTRSTSDLGAQLDSLADVVTFGAAPAFMMLRLVSQYVGPLAAHDTPIFGPFDNTYARIVWGIAAVYMCCTALRLARFNVETPSHDADDHRFFRGLPSPGAGGTVAALIVLHQHLLATRYESGGTTAFERWTALGIPLITVLCAIGMVSTIRYAHLINRYLRGRKDFAFMVRVVVPIIPLLLWFQATLAIGFTLYALSGPARAGWLLLLRRRRAAGTPAAQ
jgi:CDP-diacylglycerol--serine O-phosphatidyltransferase